MTGPNSIADSLPPPRDDEPADLRCDIIDELNDHLNCAVQRELLRGKDEADARRSAIERFGDIPTIARRLWWDAMKERIMRTRILWSLGTIATVVLILFCAFVLMSLMEITRNLTELNAAQANLVVAAPATSLEWGSLTVELLDEHGEPISDHPITIAGLMYREDKAMSRDLLTDEKGRVVLDPIRAGTGYGIQLKSPSKWRYNGSVLLEPGQDKVFTIRDRPTSPDVPVTFEFDWPKEWDGQKVQVCYPIQMMPYRPNKEESWCSPKWILVTEDGSLEHLALGITTLATGEKVNLPAGTYYLHDAVARSDDWGSAFGRSSRGIRDMYPEFTFEVKAGVVNHINIPLPPEMVDKSAAEQSGAYGGYGMEGYSGTGEYGGGYGGMGGYGGESGYGGYGGSYGTRTEPGNTTDQAEKTEPHSNQPKP